MADYTQSKDGHGEQWATNVIESVFGNLEPLMTPEIFRERFLWGLSLVSGIRDPITHKAEVMTPAILADSIDRAMAEAESQCHIEIMPQVVLEKQPFDRNLYMSNGFFKLRHRPVASIESLTVTPSNGGDLYVVPMEWIETSYLYLGQLNIIPLTIAAGTAGSGSPVAMSAVGSAMFLQMFSTQQWVPAFWQMKYTVGFKDGMLPKVINELIGVIAAQDVLSRLASTFGKSTGTSLSIDGVSQSVSSPGADIFARRQDELENRRKRLVSKIKTKFGQTILVGEV